MIASSPMFFSGDHTHARMLPQRKFSMTKQKLMKDETEMKVSKQDVQT